MSAHCSVAYVSPALLGVHTEFIAGRGLDDALAQARPLRSDSYDGLVSEHRGQTDGKVILIRINPALQPTLTVALLRTKQSHLPKFLCHIN